MTLAALVVAPRPAAADAKKDIEVKVKEAMENYDLFEYEEARKLLNTALTVAKRNKLEANPIVARVHLSLGIVYFAGLKDEPSAKLAFLSAVEIDPKVQIEPAYRSAEMAAMLEEARAEQTGSGPGPGPGAGPAVDDVDCKKVSGVQHNIIDTGTMRSKIDMEAHVGGDVKAARIVIKYRPKGKEDFTEIEMSKEGDCRYTGAIPATGTTTDLLHYYIAALGDNGRSVASKGSEGSPNIVELAAATGGSNDDDNPFVKKPKDTNNGNKITGGVVAGGKPSSVFVVLAVGTGAGYVSGETEQERNAVECCLAPGLLHVDPEIGYFVSRQLAISLAGRIGFPIGANIEGHATVGPAGLLKIRYALSPKGNGMHVSGSVGGGIIRNTIKLTEPAMGGDTDIVALGPMLVGAGAGWLFGSGKLRFNAELNAIAGIPVVRDIGQSRLNFGVQFDFNLGVQVGF